MSAYYIELVKSIPGDKSIEHNEKNVNHIIRVNQQSIQSLFEEAIEDETPIYDLDLLFQYINNYRIAVNLGQLSPIDKLPPTKMAFQHQENPIIQANTVGILFLNLMKNDNFLRLANKPYYDQIALRAVRDNDVVCYTISFMDSQMNFVRNNNLTNKFANIPSEFSFYVGIDKTQCDPEDQVVTIVDVNNDVSSDSSENVKEEQYSNFVNSMDNVLTSSDDIAPADEEPEPSALQEVLDNALAPNLLKEVFGDSEESDLSVPEQNDMTIVPCDEEALHHLIKLEHANGDVAIPEDSANHDIQFVANAPEIVKQLIGNENNLYDENIEVNDASAAIPLNKTEEVPFDAVHNFAPNPEKENWSKISHKMNDPPYSYSKDFDNIPQEIHSTNREIIPDEIQKSPKIPDIENQFYDNEIFAKHAQNGQESPVVPPEIMEFFRKPENQNWNEMSQKIPTTPFTNYEQFDDVPQKIDSTHKAVIPDGEQKPHQIPDIGDQFNNIQVFAEPTVEDDQPVYVIPEEEVNFETPENSNWAEVSNGLSIPSFSDSEQFDDAPLETHSPNKTIIPDEKQKPQNIPDIEEQVPICQDVSYVNSEDGVPVSGVHDDIDVSGRDEKIPFGAKASLHDDKAEHKWEQISENITPYDDSKEYDKIPKSLKSSHKTPLLDDEHEPRKVPDIEDKFYDPVHYIKIPKLPLAEINEKRRKSETPGDFLVHNDNDFVTRRHSE